MFKYGVVALISWLLVLFSSVIFAPASAVPDRDFKTYIWDYGALGSSEMVCKQIVFHPKALDRAQSLETQPMHIRSIVVDSNHCTNLLQPT